MKTIAAVIFGAWALLALTAGQSLAWQALVDDDSVLINRPNEFWFRGPDGRRYRRNDAFAGGFFGSPGYAPRRLQRRAWRPVRHLAPR
jgi:hypothetical protein